ncbi:MAG: diadenylate cyclase CdaA [Treponema sp.]|nr:diadenylate cyclase CdaA [Treponema sp.]
MNFFLKLYSFYNFISPIIDISILAFFLYKIYDLLVKTQAIQLVRGAIFLALVYGVAFFLNLPTIKWLLSFLVPVLFMVIAVVFQPELRKIIMRIGQSDFFKFDNKPRLGQLESVITAAEILSEQRRGALVVFPRKVNLKSIIDTGTRLNAELSSSLIITVFEFDTPLHDGAMIVQNGKITAAGCFLPLSEQQDIRKSFGTRHRAALGMSEQSDAVILVVSEETGAISLAYDAKLYYDLSSIEIQKKMKEIVDKTGWGEEAEAYASRNKKKEVLIGRAKDL